MPAKKITLPKTIGECADLLYETRQQRLELGRQLTEYEKLEAALKNRIIDELPKSNTSGVAGRVARVTVVTKEVPSIANWDDVLTYIKRTRNWHLLQRRLNTEAVKEIWDNGKEVTGVDHFKAVTVSINKL